MASAEVMLRDSQGYTVKVIMAWPNVHLGFSLTSYEKAQMNFLANLVHPPSLSHRMPVPVSAPPWCEESGAALRKAAGRPEGSIPGSGRSPGVGNGNPLQ